MESNVEVIEKPKQLRGFAAMSPEKRKACAAKGGAAVPAKLRAFAKSKHLASAAGQIGGKSVKAKDRSFSRNRSLASKAGRTGGRKTQANKVKKRTQNEQVVGSN